MVREETSLPGVSILGVPAQTLASQGPLGLLRGHPPPLHAMSLHGNTNGEAWVQPGPGSGDTAGFRLGSSLSPVTGPWTSHVPLWASPVSLSAQWGHSIIYGLDAQSCLTLCSPMDCSLSGSSVCGIIQARIPEWAAISFSRGSSRPRD